MAEVMLGKIGEKFGLRRVDKNGLVKEDPVDLSDFQVGLTYQIVPEKHFLNGRVGVYHNIVLFPASVETNPYIDRPYSFEARDRVRSDKQGFSSRTAVRIEVRPGFVFTVLHTEELQFRNASRPARFIVAEIQNPEDIVAEGVTGGRWETDSVVDGGTSSERWRGTRVGEAGFDYNAGKGKPISLERAYPWVRGEDRGEKILVAFEIHEGEIDRELLKKMG